MSHYFKIMLVSIALISCKSRQLKQAGGNYTYKTECMGTELDGSITLRAWGSGRNYFDASEQAKKNAVRDVIFKGVQDGKPECDRMPLIIEPGAVNTYEEYFAKFFADDGEYKKFVNLKDERIGDKLDRNKKIAEGSRTYSVVVRVSKLDLKKKLKSDGIIKY